MVALTPTFDTFKAGYEAGENQVVYARLAADLDTPVSLMMKLTEAGKDSFMLNRSPAARSAGAIPLLA